MQIVIDILDDTYGYFTPKKPREMTNKDAANWFVVLHKAIFVNGKVLPKGHGRLIDEKEILNNPDGIYYDLYDLPEYLEVCIPTVIEADKEVDNADSN